MEALDLPPLLAGVLDGLARQVSRAATAAAIRRQLQQAQSPLSLVRQDAYASLAASLDAYLRDPARAAAALPALAGVWPELLQSIAVGLRQAPTAGGSAPPGAPSPSPGIAPGSAGGAASYRSVSHGELTCMARVLELACLLALQARRSSLDAGLLPLLLGQLPSATPELACAAMDALLAVQLRHPAAFVSFVERDGVAQVCQLLREGGTPEPVRSHAVQFLNLLLSQLVPDLLPPDARPPPSPALTSTPRPGPPTPGPAGPAPCEGQPEATAAVLAALEGAKSAVTEVLGREVWSMLQRRISLSDISAEAKLGQLSSALTLFIESDA